MVSNNDPRYSKGMAISAFAVLFAMIGLCIYLAKSSLVRLQVIHSLSDLGVQATGEIYGGSTKSGRSSETFNIKYKFVANGKDYSGVSPVSRAAYRTAHVGSPISITYMPYDPQISRATQSVDQEQDVSEVEILIVIVVGLLAIGYNLMNIAKKTSAYRK